METDTTPFLTTASRKRMLRAGWALARRVMKSELFLVGGALAVLTVIFFYDVIFLGRTLVTSSMVWGVMGNDPPWGYPADHPAASAYLLDPLAHGIGVSTAQKAANL